MEHKKRKMFAAVIVMMLCAVAIVGVGYAYTAQTTNVDNNVGNEYITLVQGGTGGYHFTGDNTQKVYWDATDTADFSTPANPVYTTNYTLTATTDTSSVTGYTLVKLGNDFTLVAKSSKTTDLPTVGITIGATGFVMPTAGTVIILKATDGTNTYYYELTSANTFSKLTLPSTTDTTDHTIPVAQDTTDPEAPVYKPITVSLYYGYLTSTGGVSQTHALGTAPDGPSTNPVTDADLTFTITVPGSNS